MVLKSLNFSVEHKPTYSPHIDMGDHVVIINADKVVLRSDKANKNRLPSPLLREELNHVPIHFPQENPDAVRQTPAACCPKIDLADSNQKVSGLCGS